MALTHAVKESIWLQAILVDNRVRKHLGGIHTINIANQGAIALARNSQYHARTKHIDIYYHFVGEHVKKQAVTLTYCATSEMTANIFTKALTQPSFIKHNLNLGLVNHAAFIVQEDSPTETPIRENYADDEREENQGWSPREGSPSAGLYY